MFKGAVLEVFFQFRKNDQRGKGHTVKILSSKDPLCFVKLTREYFKRLDEVGSNHNSPVVPKILRRRSSGLDVYPNLVATDNACRKALASSLTDLGFEAKKYGLHSAKIGGVVHLRNAGISWRSINDYVGWAKDSVMPERYAKAACNETDKLDNILSLYAYLPGLGLMGHEPSDSGSLQAPAQHSLARTSNSC